MLERVGKETMELIIEETGMEIEKGGTGEGDQQTEEEQSEEVSFDRCFYIYGGPNQLEELEALLFNRKKTKLVAEQKTYYDEKIKEIQQLFTLSTKIEEDGPDSDKGKKIEAADTDGDAEMKNLCDSSVSKAAKMAAGWAPRRPPHAPATRSSPAWFPRRRDASSVHCLLRADAMYIRSSLCFCLLAPSSSVSTTRCAGRKGHWTLQVEWDAVLCNST